MAETPTPAQAPPAPAAPAPTAPALLAGKFKTPEDLDTGYNAIVEKLGLTGAAAATFESPEQKAAAYKILEKKLGQNPPAKPGTPPTTEPIPPTTPPAELVIPEEVPEDFTPAQLLAKAGVTQDEIQAAWLKDGKLTPDQYAKFKAVNPLFTKAMVDDYISATQARQVVAQQAQQNARTRAVQIAGGSEEQLNNLLAVGRTLPKERQADLNRRLGDPALFEGALHELKGVAGQSGQQPIYHGQAQGTGGTQPYTTAADRAAGAKAAMKSQEAFDLHKARVAATRARS